MEGAGRGSCFTLSFVVLVGKPRSVLEEPLGG